MCEGWGGGLDSGTSGVIVLSGVAPTPIHIILPYTLLYKYNVDLRLE